MAPKASSPSQNSIANPERSPLPANLLHSPKHHRWQTDRACSPRHCAGPRKTLAVNTLAARSRPKCVTEHVRMQSALLRSRIRYKISEPVAAMCDKSKQLTVYMVCRYFPVTTLERRMIQKAQPSYPSRSDACSNCCRFRCMPLEESVRKPPRNCNLKTYAPVSRPRFLPVEASFKN